MSVSILFEPVPKKDRSIDTSTPSEFIRVVEKIFGELPKIFEEDDIVRLEVLSVLNDKGTENPYRQMIDEIYKNGPIKVWKEY